MKKFFALLLFICCSCAESHATHPFGYDVHLFSVPGTSKRTMICCHGYGGNYQIAERLKNLQMIDATLVSFNFPDHDVRDGQFDPHKATFGTMNELLPVVYVLKQYVIDQGLDAIDLYGFSAGGGAVVNVLATLNSPTHDAALATLGIGPQEKKQLLAAIQKGIVILDAPFKSMEEIREFKGNNIQVEVIGKNYSDNQLRPIDSLQRLQGLSLDVILHFEEPDEFVYNRDDPLYAARLLQANRLGSTSIIAANNGGHNAPHLSLWRYYRTKVS